MAPADTSIAAQRSITSAATRPPGAAAAVTAFVCANCARPGQAPDCGARPRPTVPAFDWPFPVDEVLVSCTGRIQPEHVLKAFESGTDLVLAVACEEDNCHYLEGSRRCARRVDYLRTVLDEVGLGGERLLLFHLAGTAVQDTALGAGRPGTESAPGRAPEPTPACTYEPEDSRVAAIREEVLRALNDVAPNPMYTGPTTTVADVAYQDVDTSEDDNDD